MIAASIAAQSQHPMAIVRAALVLILAGALLVLPALTGGVLCSAEEQSAPAEAGAAPPTDTAAPPTDDRGRPLITNVFFDTDLRQALSDIAAQAGVTIMPDETVGGYVSLELENWPIESALEMLLMPGGFIFGEVAENIFLVTSPDPLAPAFRQLAITEVVSLDYIESGDIMMLLPEAYRRYVRADRLGNRVSISAPPVLLEATYAEIRKLDTPPQQVMIEALVVEIDRAKLRDFEVSAQGRRVSVYPGGGLITYVGEAQALLHQLLWLAEKQEATIRANPRIIAQEGLPAEVKVATERYFQIITGRPGFEYVRLEQIEAAISLSITPRVARERGEVTCVIVPEVSDVTGVGPNNLPIITRRTANTTVRVRDGQVIAIGGLLEEVEQVTRRKIPILGDLPVVGEIFRRTTRHASQREIVIFIAPHVLDDAIGFEGPFLLQTPEGLAIPSPDGER